MKICYISTKSIHTRRWAEYFAERGHEVHLITPEYDDIEGVKTYEVNPKASKLSPFCKAIIIRNLVKKIKPDILHAHQVVPFGLYGALSGFHPFVVSAWGSDIRTFPKKSPIHKAVVKYTLKKSDLVHVQDKLSKGIVCELSENIREKIYIQAWGVDINDFSPRNRNEDIVAKHRISNGPIIISVRNLTEDYDIKTLFKAIPYIVKEIPEVTFLILNDGYLKPTFQKMVKENKVERNVAFLGFVPFDDFVRYMASSDIFVDTFYPHDMRGGQMFGQGLLEAMASGVPQVVANRPTISEYKGKERWYFGYTYKGGNARELAQKVIKLLNNRDDMKSIGRKSREIVEERFDWNKNMAEIEKLYNRCLE